jgi:hypothetical protein
MLYGVGEEAERCSEEKRKPDMWREKMVAPSDSALAHSSHLIFDIST